MFTVSILVAREGCSTAQSSSRRGSVPEGALPQGRPEGCHAVTQGASPPASIQAWLCGAGHPHEQEAPRASWQPM